MTETAPIVFVVDDDPWVHKALRRLFHSIGFRVEGFASAEAFLAPPLPDAPSCLVLDVKMPGLSGLDLQQAFADKHCSIPIVFITGHGDVPMSVKAMRAGAIDFLLKPFDNDDLVTAVRRAIARHVDDRKEEAALSHLQERLARLTPREREVLDGVVQGLLNKQIARRLRVTEKTVKFHRAHVMEKMQAESVAELVRMAERVGIMPQRS